MKKIFLIVYISAIVLNILLGLLISKYDMFNVILNCIVLLSNMLLILAADSAITIDAFRYSITALIILLGMINYILGFFSSSNFYDNWIIILYLCVTFLEILLILLMHHISKSRN